MAKLLKRDSCLSSLSNNCTLIYVCDNKRGHKIYMPVPNSRITLWGRRWVWKHLRSRTLYIALRMRCTLRYQKLSATVNSHRSLAAQHQASELRAFQDEAISLLDNKHCGASLYWFYIHKYTLVNLTLNTADQNWCSLGWPSWLHLTSSTPWDTDIGGIFSSD